MPRDSRSQERNSVGGSVSGASHQVLIHRIGEGPPKQATEFLTLEAARSKMKLALLGDRVRYAAERHFCTQMTAVHAAPALGSETKKVERFVEKYRLWFRRVFTYYARAHAAKPVAEDDDADVPLPSAAPGGMFLRAAATCSPRNIRLVAAICPLGISSS